LIETVYGIATAQPLEVCLAASSICRTGDVTQQQLEGLAGIWDRFKQRISEQIAVFEQAAAAL